MNSVSVFDEPQLEFASGEMLEHPRDGLTLFGPVDSKGIEKPSHLCYGVVGTKSGVGAFREFVKVVNRPIPTDDNLNEVLWPHFPGFEEAFHAVLPTEPAWVEELDELVLKQASWESSWAAWTLPLEFQPEISAPASRMASMTRRWAVDSLWRSGKGF